MASALQTFNALAEKAAEAKMWGTPAPALVAELRAAAGKLQPLCPIGVTSEGAFRTPDGAIIPAEFVRLEAGGAMVREPARYRRMSSEPDRTLTVPLERLRAVARTKFRAATRRAR